MQAFSFENASFFQPAPFLFRRGAGLKFFTELFSTLFLSLQRTDFSSDDLEEATLYRLYCEPTRGSMTENQKEALRTPGIWPL